MSAPYRPSTAVVSRRKEPPDSLDYFPTPPWATRALALHVLKADALKGAVVREPACGEGHMAAVLAEFALRVEASDIFGYGFGAVEDYLLAPHRPVDWVITNPPFNKAEEFLQKALLEARAGVALLLRTVWLQSGGRFERIFRVTPPTLFAPFMERVPMIKGRWDPTASTATDYAWFVWTRRPSGSWTVPLGTGVCYIPPGQRKALSRKTDAARFGLLAPAPLLDEGAA